MLLNKVVISPLSASGRINSLSMSSFGCLYDAVLAAVAAKMPCNDLPASGLSLCRPLSNEPSFTAVQPRHLQSVVGPSPKCRPAVGVTQFNALSTSSLSVGGPDSGTRMAVVIDHIVIVWGLWSMMLRKLACCR